MAKRYRLECLMIGENLLPFAVMVSRGGNAEAVYVNQLNKWVKENGTITGIKCEKNGVLQFDTDNKQFDINNIEIAVPASLYKRKTITDANIAESELLLKTKATKRNQVEVIVMSSLENVVSKRTIGYRAMLHLNSGDGIYTYSKQLMVNEVLLSDIIETYPDNIYLISLNPVYGIALTKLNGLKHIKELRYAMYREKVKVSSVSTRRKTKPCELLSFTDDEKKKYFEKYNRYRQIINDCDIF